MPCGWHLTQGGSDLASLPGLSLPPLLCTWSHRPLVLPQIHPALSGLHLCTYCSLCPACSFPFVCLYFINYSTYLFYLCTVFYLSLNTQFHVASSRSSSVRWHFLLMPPSQHFLLDCSTCLFPPPDLLYPQQII